jgi:hypothetical protein
MSWPAPGSGRPRGAAWSAGRHRGGQPVEDAEHLLDAGDLEHPAHHAEIHRQQDVSAVRAGLPPGVHQRGQAAGIAELVGRQIDDNDGTIVGRLRQRVPQLGGVPEVDLCGRRHQGYAARRGDP